MTLALFSLLIPCAVCAWRWPRWGILGLLALLPTYLVRTTIFGIPTTWFELAVYILFVLNVVQFGWRGTFGWLHARQRFWVPALVWVGAAVVGVTIAGDVRLALGVLKGWIVDPLLLAVLVGATAHREPARELLWRDVVLALLAGAAGSSLSALAYGLSLARISGWYDSPNVMAMYLVPVAAAAMVWFGVRGLGSYTRTLRWWAGLGVLVVLMAVLRSGSYAALVAWGGSLAIVWVLQAVPKVWVVQLAGALLVISGLALPWVSLRLGYFPLPTHVSTEYHLSSGQVRLVLWRYAAELVHEHPVLGIGLGSWQGTFQTWAEGQGLLSIRNRGLALELHYASLFPHNLWLTTWLNLGLLGVGVLMWLVYQIFVAARRGQSWFFWVPVVVVVAILIHGAVDTPVYKNDLAVLWWLAVAWAASLPREPSKATIRSV